MKTELETALSPINSTLNQVKSLYETHEERICGIEATLEQNEPRLALVEAKLANHTG